MKMRLGIWVVVLMAVSLFVGPRGANAQPLADQVPADAMLYVGWAGGPTIPGYDQSHLKAILDAGGVPQALATMLPKLMDKAAQNDPKAAVAMQIIGDLGPAFWQYPTALYFGPVDLSGPFPMPRIALWCKAGPDADALKKKIDDLLGGAQLPPPLMPVTTVTNGLLTITVGPVAGAAGAAPAGAVLSGDARFLSALAQVEKAPGLIVYVDAAAVLKTLDEAVEKGPNPEAKDKWPKLRDALGLRGIEQFVESCGFDGKDWSTRVFIAAPAAGRKGLLTLLDHGAVSDATLDLIPRTAAAAGVWKLDAGKVLDEIRTMAGAVDPRAGEQFDRALDQGAQALKMDIRKDLLPALGDEWAFYLDKSMGGVVVINHLKDAAAAEKNLAQLEKLANDELARNIHGEMQVHIKAAEIGGQTVHYLAVPLVAPTWAIKNGNLYVTLYPQVMAGALEQGGKESILKNPGFVALRQRLGGEKAGMMGYSDLPQTAADGYSMMLLLSQLAVGFADMAGLDAPPMLLPPLNKILPHLAPAGSVFFADDAGFHVRNVEPFPGSTLLGAQGNVGNLQMMAPMMAAIMVPALGSARQVAMQTADMSEVRAIVMGCLLWTDQFAQQTQGFPPDLGTLAVDGADPLAVRMFISHQDPVMVPPDIDQWDKERKKQWVNDHSSYVYLGANKKNATNAEMILVYEKLQFAHDGTVAVGWGDAHVSRERIADLMRLYEKQEGKPMPTEGASGNPAATGAAGA